MKRYLIAVVLLVASAFAWAQETDPAVAAAKSANDSFVSCITAVTTAAAAVKNETVQAMMIDKAPDNCSKNVRVAQVKTEPSGGYLIWDGVKFIAGLVAQYKGQALIYGAITGVVDRMASSTDAAVTQGFNTANNGMEVSGNLAGQSIAKLPAPVWPAAPAAPAAESVGN